MDSSSTLALVVVALGSNLGDSAAILRDAARELERLAGGRFRMSSLHRTEPVDCPHGSPPFFNAVAVFLPRPGETPESLLEKLQALERRFGRRPKTVVNEPRPLDLDLILFGHERRAGPRLILPHPRARQRAFVMGPLREVAPELAWPE